MEKNNLPIQFSKIKVVEKKTFIKQIPKVKLINVTVKGFSRLYVTTFYKSISKI